ncbi:hypothetical protein [Pisciglobus halotolerans]|uniref:Uncharacterized protein n=1 Tax=Pisciglobus halotolerans TaxID=745365 RepID=A0A1I3CWG2_9LACT|nr:hypothetical protein [Pisciglobus halotolerans]SFH78571.1 hypothetical protein SAMN04489868_1247 [Pisciglobus halotolerans]
MSANNWLKIVETFKHFQNNQLRKHPDTKIKLNLVERHAHLKLVAEAYRDIFNESGERERMETLETKTLFVAYKDAVQGETELMELYDFLTKEFLNGKQESTEK